MLHSEIKQRINTCRDILVGKLPDPKSQVIQITNALIYKFMDDQDRLAEKFGGKASFFTGTLKPYAWHKLFDSKLTNQERADLYIEGVQKLSQAANLPELFREIFKEAYVPFRAAQTITLFISEINKFDYTHSEELGNAYEYLLSIMGSQGDAGQFRTPRHIIDFMVDVIDPKKGETIYDPACGTAGFLISAYTHILEANNGKLSATERRKLGENISGIDISPDMAKMARVNLYLHGFNSPVINEGDTLSDEDLWGTKYDVILANPPFMSPKGGIIPHDKFGVKAKRAEVLFVDYIAEHLKLKGRAAIVVPEGVIFQSGTTYKALRKMLVEDGYLHSVISLPAGVFQPYSGVKTSILVLDREKAKEASEVLFLRIENDGYSLGTQRTEREGSHLLEALEISKKWQVGKKQESPIASWVTKGEIAESGDYNLTGERYRAFEATISTFDFVQLGDVCHIYNGSTPKRTNNEFWENGTIPWFTIDDIRRNGKIIYDTTQKITQRGFDESSVKLLPKHSTLLCCTASIGECAYTEIELTTNQQFNGLVVNEEYKDKLDPKFLYWCATTFKVELERMSGKATFGFVSVGTLKKFKIPLPPLEAQREIVAELDRYQNIIDGAHQVVDNYKPSFKIDPEWNLVELGDLSKSKIQSGAPVKKDELSQEGDIKFVNIFDLYQGVKIDVASLPFIKSSALAEDKILNKGDILFVRVSLKEEGAAFSSVYMSDEKAIYGDNVLRMTPKTELVNPEYLTFLLRSSEYREKILSLCNRANVTSINSTNLTAFKVPVPNLNVQNEIVIKIKDELEMVSKCDSLVMSFEQKIQEKIAEVWGK